MKRHSMTLAATAVVALLFLLTLGAPRASADTFTSIIDTGNIGLSGFPGPYATVTITVTNGIATVEFAMDSGFLLGGVNAADLNLTQSATAFGFSWTGGDGSTAFTSTGSHNVDGFGNFTLTTRDFDGFNSAVSDLTFTLTGTWTDAEHVLAFNSQGWDAAAHVYVIGSDCGGSPCTGFAGEGHGVVPDGGMTLMLLGGGLVGLATLRRKFGV